MSPSPDPLITDPILLAEIEARNALLQFDEVRRLIAQRIPSLKLTVADVCGLQRIAVDGIFSNAGQFRQVEIEISNTPHVPPEWLSIPDLVAEMCEYANSVASKPLHSSAYLMWRLNWIHPFVDGNGRTSRAISYLALCCGFGLEMPGKVTVPDLIVMNREPYYQALDDADAAWLQGKLNVRGMEKLIEMLLIEQLETM